jgi:hypothetical protein
MTKIALITSTLAVQVFECSSRPFLPPSTMSFSQIRKQQQRSRRTAPYDQPRRTHTPQHQYSQNEPIGGSGTSARIPALPCEQIPRLIILEPDEIADSGGRGGYSDHLPPRPQPSLQYLSVNPFNRRSNHTLSQPSPYLPNVHFGIPLNVNIMLSLTGSSAFANAHHFTIGTANLYEISRKSKRDPAERGG